MFVLVFFSYGTLVEPNRIHINHQDINVADSKESIRMIVISDLHLGRYNNQKRLERVVKEINKIEDIDYVLLLGDIVNNTDEYLSQLDTLKQIKNKELIFVYGNHDYSIEYERNGLIAGEKAIQRVEGLEDKLLEIDITILENEAQEIEVGDSKKLVLGGIDSVWAGKADYSFIDDVRPDDTFILLCHNPDCLLDLENNPESEKVDLVLAGHTHGGEMRFPGIGSISPVGLPTKISDEYDEGLHEYKGIPIYITSGVGNVGIRMRTFNPPEIVILTIQ